jgi:hypothetical protein
VDSIIKSLQIVKHSTHFPEKTSTFHKSELKSLHSKDIQKYIPPDMPASDERQATKNMQNEPNLFPTPTIISNLFLLLKTQLIVYSCKDNNNYALGLVKSELI